MPQLQHWLRTSSVAYCACTSPKFAADMALDENAYRSRNWASKVTSLRDFGASRAFPRSHSLFNTLISSSRKTATMEGEVDAWIEQLSQCKQLSEADVKKLCDKVRARDN